MLLFLWRLPQVSILRIMRNLNFCHWWQTWQAIKQTSLGTLEVLIAIPAWHRCEILVTSWSAGLTWRWQGDDSKMTQGLMDDDWKITGRLLEDDWKMTGRWLDDCWMMTERWLTVTGRLEDDWMMTGSHWHMNGRWLEDDWKITGSHWNMNGWWLSDTG